MRGGPGGPVAAARNRAKLPGVTPEVPVRCLVLVACASLSAQAAPPLPGLDAPLRGEVSVIDPARQPPCALWTSLEQLARHAGVRMGFEQTLDCRPATWTRQPYEHPALQLDGLTVRAAFDRLLAHRRDYQWAVVDGLVLFRPRAAWANGSVLNRPVEAFTVTGQHPHHVLHAVLQATRPSLFREHVDAQLSSDGRRRHDPEAVAPLDAPIAVWFGGGTVIDALNAASRPFGGSWEVAYAPGGHGHHAFIRLHLVEADEGPVTVFASSQSFDAAAPWR